MKPIYATNKGAKAIFLFIGELHGYRNGTEEGKIARGQEAYVNNELHEKDYHENITNDMTDKERKAERLRAESDRADAHENIWLQRLYKDLDKAYGIEHTAPIHKQRVINGKPFDKVFNIPEGCTHQWTTPIELDAGASMLQYIAVLTNDERLMRATNMIGNTELNDPWSCDGIPRALFKHAATPRLYGSSQAVHEIWQDWEHEYTLEQLKLMNNQFNTGYIGIADKFKDFIIQEVNPTETMTVTIWGTTFNIECNKFKHIGTETRSYTIYDSNDNRVNMLHHTKTRSVPDLEQFRRYFVTLLIHHLDSRVADIISQRLADKYGFGIDIYDAFIINPEAAYDVRCWYCGLMEEIHANRQQILTYYFRSIGITGASTNAWNAFTSAVHQYNGVFKCRHMVLK